MQNLRACLAPALAVLLFGLLVDPACAQRRGDFRDSPRVKAAFREVAQTARGSIVAVECEGEQVALGSVVAEGGWILTKASELKDAVHCRLEDGTELPARVVAVRREYDLALLKVETDDLKPLVFDDAPGYRAGTLLVSPDEEGEPLAVGVLSVPRRQIPRRPGVLGVTINDTEDGPQVTQVLPKSAAALAGLRVDDIVLAVEGRRTRDTRELIDSVRRFDPGTPVEIRLLRGDEERTLTAVLGVEQETLFEQLGGELSGRAWGFPVALQHDTVLKPNHCGGPLLGLEGKVLGLNIARAGRVTSFALPADVVSRLAAEMLAEARP